MIIIIVMIIILALKAQFETFLQSLHCAANCLQGVR